MKRGSNTSYRVCLLLFFIIIIAFFLLLRTSRLSGADGAGTFTGPGGYTYVGEWQVGRPHGQGMMCSLGDKIVIRGA